MLYHDAEFKGSKYGIQTIIKLKEKYSNLKATLFGGPNRPKDLPEWIEYKKRANQKELKEIYNNSAVYIYPTIHERFGLTCVEAMACGCALCTTDYEGAKEFAIQNRNALISPIKDINHMVENVSTLFESPILRFKLAYQGHLDVQKFDWDISVNKLEKVIKFD